MNSDSSRDSYQTLEPSLTALLLGELDEAQTQSLQRAIDSDPALAREFERLKFTIGLVSQIEKRPEVASSSTSPGGPKLSEARRQQLLQHFKTIRPEKFAVPTSQPIGWRLAAVAVVILFATVTGLLLTSNPTRQLAKLSKLHVEPEMAVIKRKPASGTTPGAAVELGVSLATNSISFDNVEGRVTASNRRSGDPAALAVSDRLAGRQIREIVLPKAPESLPPDSLTEKLERASLREEPRAPVLTTAESNGSLNLASQSGPWSFSAGGTGALQPQQPPADVDSMHTARFFDLDDNRAKQEESELARLSRSLTPGASTSQPVQHPNSVSGPPSDKTDPAFLGYYQQPPLGSPGVSADGSKDLVQTFAKFPDRSSILRGFQPNLRGELGAVPLNAPKAAAAPTAVPALVLAQGVVSTKASALGDQLAEFKKEKEDRVEKALNKDEKAQQIDREDLGLAKSSSDAPQPQPEVQTTDQPSSTFSLNVSDVSFQLAAAGLGQGKFPQPAAVRSEEFINAFDYRDPLPAPGQRVGFSWSEAASPFAHNRDLLRLSIKTAAQGREPGRPLNLVLLLDNSGSMERADRVGIIREALRVLGNQLRTNDTLSVVTFARTARLFADGVSGDQAPRVAQELGQVPPQGGTNLEEAMNLAYKTALRHYLANGINRIALMTDGAANLGDTDPQVLKQKVEAYRKQGIATDCFGIGWEGYNDDLLEQLTRHGDGRYAFLNTPEDAASEFADKLAGSLQVAAADVKVQVEFNAARVRAYRQIGYARHQLRTEQFRDNSVDAAELGGGESGTAMYVIEINQEGQGPIGVARVRYKVPATERYEEHEWTIPFNGRAAVLEKSEPAMRLACVAGAFAEWLAGSPYANEVTVDQLIACLNGVPGVYGADARPQKLEWMLHQAKALGGK